MNKYESVNPYLRSSHNNIGLRTSKDSTEQMLLKTNHSALRATDHQIYDRYSQIVLRNANSGSANSQKLINSNNTAISL